ncbi:MAG TPA: lysylphosphatidylglycerol synthase transmembrane domain-containing protein [Solirubrobacteraceae bacterium]
MARVEEADGRRRSARSGSADTSLAGDRRDPSPGHEPDADGPRSVGEFARQHRRALVVLLLAAVAIACVAVILPQVVGLRGTLDRLRQGNKTWLLVGALFEAVSLGGYAAALRTVFSWNDVCIGWRAAYQITLAGTVATKLFAAAGAGGLALTVWALRASGLDARAVARRIAAFQILLYAVYMGAMFFFGVGLATGLLAGGAASSVTLVPAVFGAVVIGLSLAFSRAGDRIEQGLMERARTSRRGSRTMERLAAVPRTVHDGMVTAIEVLKRPRLGLLGALVYWGFDIATLWAAFHAFGAPPPVPVVVMAYVVGQLANAIPLPGGIGGVEGGMIGAFLAFGLNGGDAVLGVLAFRAISFWLPTLPGLFAYFQLRRTIARWREEPAR